MSTICITINLSSGQRHLNDWTRLQTRCTPRCRELRSQRYLGEINHTFPVVFGGNMQTQTFSYTEAKSGNSTMNQLE